MMRWFVALLLSLVSQAALAESIGVRGGDHAEFTRLVFTIPPGRPWQLGRSGAGYMLFSGDPIDSFDTSRVFDRIPSGRIAAVQTGQLPGRLQIDLGCDCHATAFLWRPDGLVIDFVDGPAPANAPFEVPLDPEARIIAIDVQSPLPLLFTNLAAAEPLMQPLPMVMPEPTAEIDAAERALISQTEIAIYDSLARAATQGLVDIVGDPLLSARATEESQVVAVDSQVSDALMAGPFAEAGAPARPGLTARTSFERDSPAGDLASGAVGTDETCLEDRHFDLASWADTRPFSEQIGEANGMLTVEFDAFPEGAVEKLARIYLHFGFGREAILALSLDGERTHEREVMIAVAQLVDGEPVASRVFDGQAGCVRAVALWSALAKVSMDGMDEVERSAAIMTFRTLPEPVRGHIGGRLAQLLLDAGDLVAADAVLGAAALHIEGPSVAADLTAAEIGLETEGADVAIAALEYLAENEPRLTPEGLVRLIDLTLREGRTVGPEIISLASAMQSEYRGAPESADLANAIVRAFVAGDQFDNARGMIMTDLAPMSSEELGQLRSDTIIAMASRMPDASFLDMVFEELPTGLNTTAENALSRRLIDLGFAERAAALISGPAEGPAMSERRYLRAEAAIAVGAYELAAEVLTGLLDPRAERLRALSRVAQGDIAAALTIAPETPDVAPDPTLAWRAGAWEELGTSTDPLLQAASEAVLTDQSALAEQQPLAERRMLLEDAGRTRELTAQLLDRFALDPVDTNAAGSALAGN